MSDDDEKTAASADAARRAFGSDEARDLFGAAAASSFGSASARPADAPPRGPRDERWIPIGIVLLSLLATGLLLWHAERGALDDPVKQGQRGIVVGAEGHSLLREANLRPALAAVARRLDADEVVTDLQVTPVQVRLSVRDAEAHQRNLSVDLAGTVRAESGGTNPSDGPALGRIDPAAPERLVSAALRAGPYAPTTVTSVAWRYDGSQERQHWTLTLKDVPIPDQSWTADATAASVRRASDPEPPAPPEPELLPTTTATPPPTVPAKPPKRPKQSGREPKSNAVVIQVGGSTIITDPASARRLNRCLRRAGNRRAAVEKCVNGLGR
jgi:hypothetical protein